MNKPTENEKDLELDQVGDSNNTDSLNSEKNESITITDEAYRELQQKIEPKKTFPLTAWLIGNKVPPIIPNNKPYPFLNANIFSIAFFSWAHPLIKIGYFRRIENEDLYSVSDTELSSRDMTQRFEQALQRRVRQWRETEPDENILYGEYVVLKALSDIFFWRFWVAGGISKVSSDIAQVTMPLLVRALVKYIRERDLEGTNNAGKAFGYCFGISLMLIFVSLNISNFFHSCMLTGAQTKAVLTNVIYRKAFKLSPKAKYEFPTSSINNLVMTDLSRIDFAVGTFHFIWSFPIAFSVATIILCVNLGAIALVGVAMVLLYVCCIFWFNAKLKRLRIESNKYIVKRARAISEIINNLRMIKFYSWEEPYKNIVQNFRNLEKKYILRMQLLKAVFNTATASITILATMVVFIAMYHIESGGGSFNSYNVFSAVTLFSLLRMPLNLLPLSCGFAIDAQLAFERLAEFLQAEESEDIIDRLPLDSSKNAIEINNGTYEWDTLEEELLEAQKPKTKKQLAKDARSARKLTRKEGKDPTKKGSTYDLRQRELESNSSDSSNEDLSFPGLKNINLTIRRKELIIVTGSIGTGKTSLLNAIDGSMKQVDGDSKVYGSLTFCSYPWIQNATIKENVLFGSKWDPVKYEKIVKACALDIDFKSLQFGDQTEVGERGITLSGGQKARINLARAVYSDSDVILLDDVLSAVDSRVGKHIMKECICGILKDKTRILATHQLSLIDDADRIIFLNGTGFLDIGTESELTKRNPEFSNLMEYSKTQAEDEEESDDSSNKDQEEELNLKEVEIEAISKQVTKVSEKVDIEKSKSGSSTESRSINKGSLKLYGRYVKLGAASGSYYLIILFLFSIVLAGFVQVFYSVWLSFWLEDKFELSSGAYTGIYVAICFSSVLVFLTTYSLLAYVNNKAGLILFNVSAEKLLKAPMSFMDVTPIGRILNRFTKDVDTLDTNLIEQMRLFLTSIALVGSTAILSGIYIPWFFIVIPVALFFYSALTSYYLSSALDIKRLEANNRSLVFSHFNESLNGMKVIKSYSASQRFIDRFDHLIDDMDSAYYFTLANQRWLATRLDTGSSIVTFLVSMMCAFGVFNINSSSSGLLVSYIVQVASSMSLLLRSMTQVENDMNSAERLFEYATELPQEAQHESTSVRPEPEWPRRGAIEFTDVSLSYREGLPLVLKDVTFKVEGGQKIGVCGRTGAGKSTIMNALFRINELANGKVTIDDLDISGLGLNDLRSKLSIIPQDPVLFHGTIRQNLDPFATKADADLWDALRRSWLVEDGASGTGEYKQGVNHLKSLHKFHLDQIVEDDGSNFSLGERQLLALARALVRNSKILILDEATSSVDYEADAKIQSTIVNEFSQCTILCIAHRLKTILNYDKILVLDKGEVIEFDTPYNLFKLGGIFTEMCEKANIGDADFQIINQE
ncbi:hypothetical protein WICMUC_003111 [Wickerhamomyces mucosus]|uniref:Oligomycin resistance ATP-dependent permease YOR1 n=1 Tax=Wickerhamomyces mucosus TaxID=1378264 RepID=A0A9P8PND8_9ASCO|nr:hypothetical protein WICMUC_003111 [Wickerhamomyces mucosus]